MLAIQKICELRRMRIKEFITIDRSKEIVWEHVHDPNFMRTWNPRVHYISPDEKSLPGLNYRFKVNYEILGKPENFTGQVIEYEKNTRIRIIYKDENKKYPGYITESFELYETRNGTKLCHYFDFKHSGINYFIKLALYIIGFLSRPIGRSYLAKLKTSIET